MSLIKAVRSFPMLNLKTALKRQRATLSRLRTETNGNTSLLFAVSVSTLLLAVPVVIDLNTTLTVKSKMQASLDTAVLAAAQNGNADDFITFGEDAYDLDVSDDRLARSTLRFEKQNTGDENEMVGTATTSLNLAFSRILKKSAADITVHSVVNVAPSASLPCRDASGLKDDASTEAVVPACEVDVPAKRTRPLTPYSKIIIE